MTDAERMILDRERLVQKHLYPDCACDACFWMRQAEQARDKTLSSLLADLEGYPFMSIAEVVDHIHALKSTASGDSE